MHGMNTPQNNQPLFSAALIRQRIRNALRRPEPTESTAAAPEWPEAPEHTCDHSWVATFELHKSGCADLRMGVATAYTWRWVDNKPLCEGCYHDRVLRLARQVAEEQREGPLFMAGPLPDTQTQRLINAWRQRKARGRDETRYLRLPLFDDASIVIHSDPRRGDPRLTKHPTALYHVIYPYANTPHDRRLSSSPGWGGDFVGMRGDGRNNPANKVRKKIRQAGDDPIVKSAQHIGLENIRQAAAIMGVGLNKQGRGFASNIDPCAAYDALKESQIRGYWIGGSDQWHAFCEAWKKHVTDNVQKKPLQIPLSLMRDNDSGGEPPGGPTGSKLGAFQGSSGERGGSRNG